MPAKFRTWLFQWGPAIAWMGAIFFVSAQSSLPQAPDTLLDLILKKGLHMIAYGVLAGLFWRALNSRPAFPRAGMSWLLAVLYAATDEYHQTFVPGRHGRLMDLLFDGVGALIALWLLWRWERRAVRRLNPAPARGRRWSLTPPTRPSPTESLPGNPPAEGRRLR